MRINVLKNLLILLHVATCLAWLMEYFSHGDKPSTVIGAAITTVVVLAIIAAMDVCSKYQEKHSHE